MRNSMLDVYRPEQPRPSAGCHGRPCFPEKLIDVTRCVKSVGMVWVDTGAELSSTLAKEVATKAIKLEASMKHPDSHYLLDTFTGQAGLIRGHQLTQSSPQQPPQKKEALAKTEGETRPTVRFDPEIPSRNYAITPITCIHNVVDEKDNFGNITMRFRECSLIPACVDRTFVDIHFGKSNYESSPEEAVEFLPHSSEGGRFTWEYYDVTTAPMIDNPKHKLTHEVLSYEKVRADFVLQKGQKIGMAIHRDFAVTAKHVGMTTTQIAEEDLNAVFGKPNRVYVYTGQVTDVTQNGTVIQHNINAFSGCSGAVIFLLDLDQNGVGVREEDYGKAVAIHCGSKKMSNATALNFGFKIP